MVAQVLVVLLEFLERVIMTLLFMHMSVIMDSHYGLTHLKLQASSFAPLSIGTT